MPWLYAVSTGDRGNYLVVVILCVAALVAAVVAAVAMKTKK